MLLDSSNQSQDLDFFPLNKQSWNEHLLFTCWSQNFLWGKNRIFSAKDELYFFIKKRISKTLIFQAKWRNKLIHIPSYIGQNCQPGCFKKGKAQGIKSNKRSLVLQGRKFWWRKTHFQKRGIHHQLLRQDRIFSTYDICVNNNKSKLSTMKQMIDNELPLKEWLVLFCIIDQKQSQKVLFY